MRPTVLLGAALMIVPVLLSAQHSEHSDLTRRQHAAPDAAVDFGVFPTGPLGPEPCLQSGAIGGPADPCGYKLHLLTPDEVTIQKGGQVTFQFHGGGHAMAIYEVSKNTNRDEIGQMLCPGFDPATIPTPDLHNCSPLNNAANSNLQHVVLDGRGDVVIVAAPGTNTGPHPTNRVWYEPDRLMSAGGRQFLNGGTLPAGPNSDGQLVSYRFLKNGRYLVICMNRSHFLNDWMFGFVNVRGN